MRYVIVDPEGSSRAHFGSLRAVREWARELKAKDPELLTEMLMLTYDAAGNEVASQWLSDFVPEVPAIISMAMFALETASAMPMQLTGPGLSVGWSGTAGSTTPVFHRPHTLASDTDAHELAGTAAG
jgi:hypothetical protein